MKYKLIDLQGAEVFLDKEFETKEEARQALINYHSVDWDSENGKYPIENMSLNDLLDYGCFEIEEI